MHALYSPTHGSLQSSGCTTWCWGGSGTRHNLMRLQLQAMWAPQLISSMHPFTLCYPCRHSCPTSPPTGRATCFGAREASHLALSHARAAPATPTAHPTGCQGAHPPAHRAAPATTRAVARCQPRRDQGSFDIGKIRAHCRAAWGVEPVVADHLVHDGGLDYRRAPALGRLGSSAGRGGCASWQRAATRVAFLQTSLQCNRRFITNVVFTNGLLDPWSAFGLLRRPQGVDASVDVITIPDGGHHGRRADARKHRGCKAHAGCKQQPVCNPAQQVTPLYQADCFPLAPHHLCSVDLMFSHPEDSDAIRAARARVMENVRRWVGGVPPSGAAT